MSRWIMSRPLKAHPQTASIRHSRPLGAREWKTFGTSERGSLALEQVLFIGAIITMSLGVFAFYENIATYFRNVSITALPTQLQAGGPSPAPDAD